MILWTLWRFLPPPQVVDAPDTISPVNGGASVRDVKEALKTELTYFVNQRPRMDYAIYLKQALSIASGVIEATCKTLVTQRMKCSGMRWGMPGDQAILSLR